MKPFEFSLEKVLKVRRQQEQLIGWKQQHARAALEIVRAEANELLDKIRETVATLSRPSTPAAAQQPGRRAAPWQVSHQQSRWLASRLVAVREKERLAKVELEKVDELRRQALREVEALLVLHRQQWRSYQQKLLRDQQLQLDEQAMRRWLATSKHDENVNGIGNY